MPPKIAVIFGTRPEAIKLAPVMHALKRSRSLCPPWVCVTGQHREMLDQMLQVFEIVPDHDLAVMAPGQSLSDLTARLLQQISPLLAAERPDAILVQGDTATTFAAALAGYYLRIPTGHVEAGLRTGDPYNPFPEEVNRRLTSHLATWHFAPTAQAEANLLNEGVPRSHVVMTGNTVVDALHEILARLERHAAPTQTILSPEQLRAHRLILVTGHRRESFGEGLRQVCTALHRIAERNADALIVYPVHLNPHVQEPVHRILGDHPRILLTRPLDYLPFVDLLRRAYVVLTDSGGIQEEAPSVKVPVLVLRQTTERPEGVEAGVARLVGTDPSRIVAATEELLRRPELRARMVAAGNPYGDGHAAEAIVSHLEHVLGQR